MAAPPLPSGLVVLLRPDSWIPIGAAQTPSPAVMDDFRDITRAYPNCTSSWGNSAGGEYWMSPGEWYDIASNLTGPDQRQGALIGFYIEGFLLGDRTEDAIDTFFMSLNGVVRGQFVQQSAITTHTFADPEAGTGEPCGYFTMWMGTPQLPIFNRPTVNNLDVKGDWILGGAQSGGSMLVVNATAILQEVSTEPVTTTTTTTTTSQQGSANSFAPSPSSTSKSHSGVIITAVVVPVLALAMIALLGIWLLRRRRARQDLAEPPHHTDWLDGSTVPTYPQSPSETPSVTAYTLAGTSTANASVIATPNDKVAQLDEKLTPLPLPSSFNTTADVATPKHTFSGTSAAHDRSGDARASGVYLPSPSSAPSTTLPPPSPLLLSSTIPPRSSRVLPTANSAGTVSNPDEEDDETALRELRGAMRSAGFTINSLFARLGAGTGSPSGRAESVTGPTEDGLPAYDASAVAGPHAAGVSTGGVNGRAGLRRLPSLPRDGE